MEYFDLPEGKTFLISQKALIVKDTKLLVLKNKVGRWVKKAQWELPGGTLETDEDLKKSLKREVLEETGLTISVGEPIAVWTYWLKGFEFKDGRRLDAKAVSIAYMCKKIKGKIRLGDEHGDYRWATKDELRTLEFAQNSYLAIEAFLRK